VILKVSIFKNPYIISTLWKISRKEDKINENFLFKIIKFPSNYHEY